MLPIIDCIRRTPIKDFEIFHFSIIEIFNIIIIGYTTVLTLINLIHKKKEYIPLIIYSIILLGYVFLHNLNILHFDSSIFPDSDTNIITSLLFYKK